MDLEIVENGSVTSPQGFSAGAVYAGIKSYGEGKLDLGLLLSQVPGHAAGIFTTNRVKAAPVLWCRERLASGRAQAVVVNSGVANACVGPRGLEDAAQMARLAAARLAVDPGLVLVASTGKIGVPLPMEKIAAGLERIALSTDGGHELARCIMTTDTFAKEVAVRLGIYGVPVTVAGTAKGAGMIHPQMATMLAFLTTDAAVEPGFLPKALARAAADSFHMVSVDGDMSTNDTLVVLANGLAGNRPIARGTRAAKAFQEALNFVCQRLARSIARDGEGATKLVTVTVLGAKNRADARAVARAVARSNLTKCAIHGADPNWGRIAAAAGQSGGELDPDRLDIAVGEALLFQGGLRLDFDDKQARAALSGNEVAVRLDLHLGPCSATAWGCDLSEEYVTFNSQYTT